MPTHDLQYEQYQQCAELYKQEKFTECTELCSYNMTDINMPRHLQIKTLILMAGAAGSEDDSESGWQKAEYQRLNAERLFHATRELMIKRAPQMTEATRAEEEVIVKELRGDLDTLLEWQADQAPNALIERSLRDGHFPPREGIMMDALYTRQYLADDEMEDDDDIPLENTKDVHEAEMQGFGSDQGIVDYLKGVSLEESMENTSDENAVDQNVVGENKSEGKKPIDDKPDDEKKRNTLDVASPTKKKQSTANPDRNTPSRGSGLGKKRSTASLIPKPRFGF